MLDKLKPIGDATRVGSKEKSSVVESFLLMGFFGSDFRTELDTSSYDATIYSCCRITVLQIKPGIGFAKMSCEWASILSIYIFRKTIIEVIVFKWVCTNSGVILEWCKINRCTYILISLG